MQGKYASIDGSSYIICYIKENRTIGFQEVQKIPENFQEIDDKYLERELEEYVANKKRQKFPFLFYTRKDIVTMVREKIENPTQIHYAMAVTFLLLKIATLFQENPELIFDIPLYEEYVTKHGLDKREYTIEDFLGSVEDVLEIIN